MKHIIILGDGMAEHVRGVVDDSSRYLKDFPREVR